MNLEENGVVVVEYGYCVDVTGKKGLVSKMNL